MARSAVIDSNLIPKGYQQLTTLSSVKGLSPPSRARVAILQAVDQDIRWRDDGTDPTASIGMLIPAGRDLFYTGDLVAIKFIEASAGAELNVSFYE